VKKRQTHSIFNHNVSLSAYMYVKCNNPLACTAVQDLCRS